jgi:type IV pilus assembly protein PilE
MELMFVAAIVAICAGVAIPAYTYQVQKNARSQGKARLVQTAQLLERFYSDNNSYYVDVSGGNLVVGTASTAAGFAKLLNVTGTTIYSGSNNESTSPYTVTLTTANANSYTLTATPRLAQAGDTKCANLTLTNTGVKGYSGTAASLADCW